MKKILFAVISFVMVGCSNPSMERGLELLTKSLAEVEASFVALNIEQMQADLISMQDMVDDMVVTAEESRVILDEAMITIDNILAGLANAQANLENAVTKEQVAALADQVDELGEGIDVLVFIADYDYDGVMNGLDQCPDTPLSDINDVNGVGCAPGQTPITSTTTTTTGG
jgi:hypothetical protein